MPTTKFLEPGTDATQDFSFFGSTQVKFTGALTSATDQAYTGPRSMKCAALAANDVAHALTPVDAVADAGAAISFQVRFSTVSPSVATSFFDVEGPTGLELLAVLNTNGTLGIEGYNGTTNTKNGSTVLVANRWYSLSISYVVTSPTSWTMKLFINGVLEVTATNADSTLSNTGGNKISLGINDPDAFATSIVTLWIDDIYVDDRSDLTAPGDIRVTNKRPNANGAVNDFTTQIGAGGSGYGTGHSPQVNEQPLNEANGWSVAAVAVTTEEYNVESPATGDVDLTTALVVDYMGWVRTKALVAETGKIRVNNVDTAISIATSPATFTAAAGSASYPAGAGADIGMLTSATVTTVSLYECGVVIAYKPVIAGTSLTRTFR